MLTRSSLAVAMVRRRLPFALFLPLPDLAGLQQISLGGAIGTGIFLGTANALRMGGPLGILLGYSIMGTIVYSVR